MDDDSLEGARLIPTLTTERVRLRPLTLDDAPAMLAIMTGRDVLKYFPVPGELTVERMTQRIQSQLDHWTEHKYGVWAAETLGGMLIGNCGLQLLPAAGKPEIDFLLGREFWGHGFATEAARAAIRWGFETHAFPVVAAVVHVDNVASRHVLEKLGMKRLDTAEWFGMPCEYLELERKPENG